MAKSEKIVIKTVNKPTEQNSQALTDWFFDSFDLSGKGDEGERIMFRQIVINTMKGEGVASKVLSTELSIPLSTVIYDLNKFINSGLIVRKGRKYYLRENDFESTIQAVQAEMLMEFNRMMQFASKLDEIIESEINDRGKTTRGRKQK